MRAAENESAKQSLEACSWKLWRRVSSGVAQRRWSLCVDSANVGRLRAVALPIGECTVTVFFKLASDDAHPLNGTEFLELRMYMGRTNCA